MPKRAHWPMALSDEEHEEEEEELDAFRAINSGPRIWMPDPLTEKRKCPNNPNQSLVKGLKKKERAAREARRRNYTVPLAERFAIAYKMYDDHTMGVPWEEPVSEDYTYSGGCCGDRFAHHDDMVVCDDATVVTMIHNALCPPEVVRAIFQATARVEMVDRDAAISAQVAAMRASQQV